MVALCGLLGMSACEIPFEIEQKGTSLIYFQAIANQDTLWSIPATPPPSASPSKMM